MYMTRAVSAPAAMGSRAPHPPRRPRLVQVNNRLMKRPVIKVAGADFYGCCETLAGPAREGRGGADRDGPGEPEAVDKAKAVIGITHDGNAICFENRGRFLTYSKQLASATK